MNRNEYMAALRRALSALPEEERASALRYYEEYFDDAGPENEQQVISDLGAPEKVAEQILADYRELTAVPHQGAGGASGKPKRRWRGVPPWLLIVLALLAIPVGLPLLGVLVGVIGAIAGILLAAVAIAIVVVVIIPLTLLITGVILCGFSFALWGIPASAVTTLGCGLALFALGVLVTLLMIKLCTLFVPPLFRGFVTIIRWPFDKLRGRTRNHGGGTQ
ncbi:MAG TPA: DUF1700 domain-containing protein [Candidatus Agathobaculum merdigallinarum]|nr:DUF1700 domain-containing protein [Candidatus Agathobaculum merdigallinarum]